MVKNLSFPPITDVWDENKNLEDNIKQLLEKYFGEIWVKCRFNGTRVDNKAIWILIDADTGFIHASEVYYICVNFLNDNWLAVLNQYQEHDFCCIYVDWT
jgi:hypothetical protein